MIETEQIVNTFHDPAYCYESLTGKIHRIEDGRVLCGTRTWLYAVPRELIDTLLPAQACLSCRRVQLARQCKQLTLEEGGQ